MSRKAKNIKEFDLSDYELNETDKQVFKLKHQYPELKNQEIAKLLKLDGNYISTIIHKPAYQRALREFNKTWVQTLIDAKSAAARKLVDHVQSKNERVSLDAAKSILQIDKIDIGSGEEEKANF